MIKLDEWVKSVLAHPVTKQPASFESFQRININSTMLIDARVFLKNTYGYSAWAEGQAAYEAFAEADKTSVEGYKAEIEYDRPVYEHYQLQGRILDCGGGAGTVREFLANDVEFISTDPWIHAPFASSLARKAAYSCLNQPLNFIAATAEFQPF
ncbi:hypothetical protein L5220_02670 [Synechococcus sp. PCC 6716]|nr:hypothetical protein [Synechococcus sp. PCC 6716]